jgi:hypothetical protein
MCFTDSQTLSVSSGSNLTTLWSYNQQGQSRLALRLSVSMLMPEGITHRFLGKQDRYRLVPPTRPPGSYHGWTLNNWQTTATVGKQPSGHTCAVMRIPMIEKTAYCCCVL